MELSQKQKEIVESKESKIVVISSASSGKTRILTERLKYLLNSGVKPEKIVAITFTNLAAEEIRSRVGEIAKNCFIGTVHSYCNYLLMCSGIKTKEILSKEKFDDLFKEIKKHPNCARPVEHLLLDEAQDSNELQFEFLLNVVHPENYMLVGDFKQSIFQFNGSQPEILIKLSRDFDVFVYNLNENYRNGRNILDYAKMIIRQNGYEYIDSSIPMRAEEGKVVATEYSPLAIVRDIKKTDKFGNFGDWFILCRTNSQVESMFNILNKNDVPSSIIRKKDFLDLKELQEKMEDNTVKVMTIHQSKGLEAKNVVVIGATLNKYGTQKEIVENTCLNYVAATRARDLLVWTHTPKYRKKSIRNWE